MPIGTLAGKDARVPGFGTLAGRDARVPGKFMSDEIFRPDGWHNRGYLPHFDGGEISQFITFRLSDSLPQTVLNLWREQLSHKDLHEMEVIMQRRIEKYLDQNYGECYLKDKRIASIVQDSLLFFDSKRYRILSWVIMPNHVHLLMTPCSGFTLSGIMHSIKSFTGQEANKILNRKGKFWMDEYFDRYIRDSNHFEKAVAYIENNPVKARLCKTPDEWEFSSAYRKH